MSLKKNLSWPPFLGPDRGQSALDPTFSAHSRFKDLDALWQAISALSCLEIEMPTMKGAGHLTPGDDAISKQSALVWTDSI